MKIFKSVRDFFNACGGSDLKLVKKLYSSIEDVNFTITNLRYNVLQNYKSDSYYYTPLYASSYQTSKDSYKIAEFLLKKGANPNFKCNDYWGIGSSPLHSMIANSFEKMPFRMQMDWDKLEETDDEVKLEITGLELLVKYGAEINIKDADGETPLDWAIRFEHKPAEKYLRSLGAKKGSEISDEENLLLEKKLRKSVQEINYHFVSWEEETIPDPNPILDDESLPKF